MRIWNNWSAPTLLGRRAELGVITLRKCLPAFVQNIPTLHNKCMDTKGEAGWDELGDWDCYIYTAIIKQIIQYSTGNSIHCPVETQMGRKSKTGDICICIADSPRCTVETNTTL